MRKGIIILLLIILTTGLCSCVNTAPSGADLAESVGTEDFLAEANTSGSAIAGEGSSIKEGSAIEEEPADSKGASIIFRGKMITAPGAYPDVPDGYVPILDDLYLYGELLHQYGILPDEEQEGIVREEFRILQEKIQQRGYVDYPYGSNEGSSGYALIDLDGDDNPELLLLSDYSDEERYRRSSLIYSIFTLRNGQLVSVINDSYQLREYTILAEDGLFYQCINGPGTGYATLTAFGLEADKTEVTIVSEVMAALSFADGDIPVPYWTKKENGQEINITEEAFEALREEYVNLKGLMPLNFIPLPSGGEEETPPVQEPEEMPSPLPPVEYPQSYQGAPEEYQSILDSLYLFAELTRQEEVPPGGELWEHIGFVDYPQGRLGYAVTDINSDGITELILGAEVNSPDGATEFDPYSIFTLRSGEPVFLTSFWSRSRGVITADGTIYNVGSGGAAYTYLSAYRLDKKADKLTQLTDIRSDYSASENKAYFVQVTEGKNHYISQAEFDKWCELYGAPPDVMQWNFIPIAD